MTQQPESSDSSDALRQAPIPIVLIVRRSGSLSAITAALEEETDDGFVVGYGGGLFAHGFPSESLAGRFLGTTAREAVDSLEEILGSRTGIPS